MLNYHSRQVSLDDLVFEWRNKEYGAYVLRQRVMRYSTWALFITVTLFLLLLVGPLLWQRFHPAPAPDPNLLVCDFPVVLTPVAPLDPKTPPPPPLPASAPPPVIATVKFPPPELAPDHDVTETPPRQDILVNTNPGAETRDGVPSGGLNDIEVSDGAGGNGPAVAAPIQEEEFTAVEEMPGFPGGFGEMQKFLQSKVKYPARAQSAEIQGTVYVEIIVSPTGEISEPKVIKSLGFGLDEEAVRLIKLMPPFTPGRQNGRAVKVRMTMPIKFRLG